MPRTTKKAMQAERQNPAAPYLFDEQQMPLRHDAGDEGKQGRNLYTGARLLENDQKCLRMVELLMANWGLKRTAKAMHSSKESVKAARDAISKASTDESTSW